MEEDEEQVTSGPTNSSKLDHHLLYCPGIFCGVFPRQASNEGHGTHLA
jgi:hypothetical protein